LTLLAFAPNTKAKSVVGEFRTALRSETFEQLEMASKTLRPEIHRLGPTDSMTEKAYFAAKGKS